MAQVDFQHREIAIKLVYYGPALSGKTTNLQQIHARIDQKRRGRLLTLDTKEDRTLYFDLLPLAFKSTSGVTFKVKLFTVPGQVMHNTTRKVVLQGCDGVAFVADSQIAETQEQQRVLRQPEGEHEGEPARSGRHPDRDPVQQARHAQGAHRRGSQAIAARGKEAVFPATAIEGKGVVETFLGLAAADLGVAGEADGARHASTASPRRSCSPRWPSSSTSRCRRRRSSSASGRVADHPMSRTMSGTR